MQNGEGIIALVSMTALEYLQSIYRNPAETENRRLRAAEAALPYESPKLSARAYIHDLDAFAVQLENAINRSQARLIEAKPLPTPEEP
jgi:hypothetical protein